MSDYSSLPTANPAGSRYTADDLKLRRDRQPASIWSGAFGEAWGLVKAKPVETLLLSFVWMMFNGGGSSFNFPSGGGSGGSDQTAQQASDYSGALFDSIGHLVARIGAMEMALIGTILAVVLMLMVVGLVLGTLVRGGATIFWLRHVRGQDASLNHVGKTVKFFVPLLLSSLASGIAIVFGVLAFIVPGIIIALGFTFVNQVVVDKNLGWLEALRASWRMADGYKLDLFVFAILCAALNFAGVLACCIGVVVTNAVVMGESVIVYDRIAEPGNAYLDQPFAPVSDDGSGW